MDKHTLRTIRQEHGWSQRELAEEMGYAEDSIRHMEAGRASITHRFEKQLNALLMKKRLEKSLRTT